MSVSSRASERFRADELSVPSAAGFPLSYAQETMLYWDKLVPRSAVYNVPVALHIRGSFDVRALRKTVRMIISRHEILRSHFLFTEDEPVQVVGQVSSDEDLISTIDLSARDQSTAALKQAVNFEARRPFNLAKDVMLRAIVFHLAKDDQILLLNMHHIAADGWSVGVLLREVSEGYLAFSQGKNPDLPATSAQYAGFAQWQREMLQGPERERALSFWRDQLAGLPEMTEVLPLDRPRPAQQSIEGTTLITNVPGSLLAALTQVGQKRRATAFMVMLAAFQVLLRRYSGKDVIAIGTPVANRARADFLDLIGCFINMVVIRGDLSGNPTFIDFVSRIRETSLAAFFHPELPFSELVRHLHPKRSVSHTPFFQVQMVYHNYPMPEIHWPGLQVTRFDVDTATSKFDLSVLMEPRNGLEIGIEYNVQLFERATIQRLLEQYTSLLQSVVSSPGTRIDDFPIRGGTGNP